MEAFMKEFEHLKIQLEDIKKTTNNFSNQHIGSGGFGKVYQGELSHYKGKSVVAIKRLDSKVGQGEPEFWREITMLTRHTHPNLISLLGFCIEGREKILVLEYASNGSVNHHLRSTDLTWSQRIKICLDAATGIRYLHEDKGLYQRVLHRDIKSSNILLDHDWNAKISDMGLAKMGPANQQYTALFTDVVGTFGYLDPVYLDTGVINKESDVYSFGVVLIEVLCGRLCVGIGDDKLSSLLVPVWKKSFIDKKLDAHIFKDQPMDPTCLETFSDIAFQCVQISREKRPIMSLVVEKLELALKLQESYDLKMEKEYEKILEAAVNPLVYRSVWELKLLLSKGLFLNEGKTWFSLNDKGQHCVLMSIDECIDSFNKDKEAYRSRYSHDYNSRFQVGTYITRGWYFNTRVRCEFLSRGITYMMNLVFKCSNLLKQQTQKKEYIAIPYKLNWEKRIAIVHIGDKREDEWLKAGLHQFTTSNNNQSDHSFLDLRIEFDKHEYSKVEGGLEIEGIEFQPVENVYELEHDDQVQLDQYQEILKAAVAEPPLFYRSIKELKLLLSRGVLLNRGETWFYLNDNGVHCEMISIKECVISKDNHHYSSDYNSRFSVGALTEIDFKSRTCVRPQFLSPYITYTVNLVFRVHGDYNNNNTESILLIGLKYKLAGETKTRISYLADKREDNWWMVELFQFTSDGTTVDLEIVFDGNQGFIVEEGIEFQPLEIAEHEVMDGNKENMLSISDSDDTYWEQKLPDDYKDIIKLSKYGVQWTTKKELYSILSRGFLTDNGQEWIFLDKNGKRCQMLSARASFVNEERYSRSWRSLPESRFREVFVVPCDYWGDFETLLCNKIKSQGLSIRSTYACYLIYKLPKDHSHVEPPLKVSYEDFDDSWYIYLVSPPKTPVIVRGRVNENTYNPLKRPKLKAFPRQRRDGWMEVQLCEFQTDISIRVIPSLKFKCSFGVIIQGIELRSV